MGIRILTMQEFHPLGLPGMLLVDYPHVSEHSFRQLPVESGEGFSLEKTNFPKVESRHPLPLCRTRRLWRLLWDHCQECDLHRWRQSLLLHALLIRILILHKEDQCALRPRSATLMQKLARRPARGDAWIALYHLERVRLRRLRRDHMTYYFSSPTDTENFSAENIDWNAAQHCSVGDNNMSEAQGDSFAACSLPGRPNGADDELLNADGPSERRPSSRDRMRPPSPAPSAASGFSSARQSARVPVSRSFPDHSTDALRAELTEARVENKMPQRCHEAELKRKDAAALLLQSGFDIENNEIREAFTNLVGENKDNARRVDDLLEQLRRSRDEHSFSETTRLMLLEELQHARNDSDLRRFEVQDQARTIGSGNHQLAAVSHQLANPHAELRESNAAVAELRHRAQSLEQIQQEITVRYAQTCTDLTVSQHNAAGYEAESTRLIAARDESFEASRSFELEKDQLHHESTRLVEGLSSEHGHINELRSEYDITVTELTSALSDRASPSAAYESLEAELEEARGEISDLNGYAEGLRLRTQSQAEQVRTMSGQLNNLQLENLELSGRIENAELERTVAIENSDISAKLKDATTRLDQLTAQHVLISRRHERQSKDHREEID